MFECNAHGILSQLELESIEYIMLPKMLLVQDGWQCMPISIPLVKGVELGPGYFHAAFIEHKKHKYLLSKMLNATYKSLV